ncbi:gluconate 2-dehydrogenase subunit 3 family protein [Brevibacillus massiliensis]|jgi:hypothetical protein|uniref:gluconate 2-dehydrogenase subunit 3 family protein n=1 Tax=Brevibacillus massiliensis TaxID=1118054 RepID=UPI0003133B40|nr:gluconate 2-dehydrogenase subunit 3 family protein [Brevibacillus massiliensis]
MVRQSHYPSFDVLRETDAWDDHTQSIVTSRVRPKTNFQFLTKQETELLRAICSLLVDDQRLNVLSYVLEHIDQTLTQAIGEGQRKAGVPNEQILIREGLQAIDAAARQLHATPFTHLKEEQQTELLQALSQGHGNTEASPTWDPAWQQPLFDKLLTLTIESYCSHPAVWSEIGYAGPAYPRGYVRTQLGQLDPWEAQPES